MQAAFVRYIWENDSRTIATFYFEPRSPYRFDAGQYAILRFSHTEADNRGIERTMTISSSPDEPLLAFTMKIYQPGSSFKRALLALQPGDEITINESLGDLVLPMDPDIPLVFIAGGVGIASFTGMTSWLTTHNDKRNVQLHYLAAQPEDFIFRDVFERYRDIGDLTTTLYTPSVKRLTADDILHVAKPDSLFYLSGTENMVESLRGDLMRSGIPRGQIVFDYFDGYSEL